MAKYSRPDRFGNEYQLVNCKPNKNGYPTGYLEMGNKLYQFAVSENKKDGGYWVRVTSLKKSSRGTF
jgi:hypothetical protein